MFGMEDEELQVPDHVPSHIQIGDHVIPIVEEETERRREWGAAMKRVQLLSDEELFTAVRDPHPGARCEALLRLRARCAHDPRTLTAMIETLNDSDPDVRDACVSELGNLADVLEGASQQHAIDAIRTALNDANEDVRASAKYQLRQRAAE